MNQTVAVVSAPASKSYSHRAMIAASLAGGESRLSGVLESVDLTRTRAVLTAAGASIEREGVGEFTVSGMHGQPQGSDTADSPLDCYMAESGTSCRLLTAILAAGQGYFRIHGSGRLHDRPIGELADTLTSLGAEIRYEAKPGCPPFVLYATGLRPGRLPDATARISCSESSQYLSGLLLAAPLGEGLTILLTGDKTVSWPYVSLTLQTMADWGIRFRVERLVDDVWQEADWRTMGEAVPGKTRFLVEKGLYQTRDARVEGDYSNASYFLAAGAMGPRPVRVEGLRRDSLQGDAAMLDILGRMGARVEWQGDEVTVSPAPLHGIDVDMGSCPDIVPTMAVLATAALGETRIRNVAHLRVKECDRLEAPVAELRKLGFSLSVTDDGLLIQGTGQRPTGSFDLSSHNDHRMAMSLALLELYPDLALRLDDPSCVAKSNPRFWDAWERVVPQTRKGAA